MRPEPTIVRLPIESLVPADWNWKTKGENERVEKFIRSIEHDRSAGVLAVRELGNKKYEVIDGNHRLTALKQLKWKAVPCENFGALSLAEAMTTARRRNFDWFEDDIFKYAKAFQSVTEEIPVAELAMFMPETRNELETLAHFTDFSWQKHDALGETSEKTTFVVTLKVDAPNHKLWLKLLGSYYNRLGVEDPAHVFIDLIKEKLQKFNGQKKKNRP